MRDLYVGLRDGALILEGQVNNDHLRGDIGTPTGKAFSVGEMQRLAVARAFTFMRSLRQSSRASDCWCLMSRVLRKTRPPIKV